MSEASGEHLSLRGPSESAEVTQRQWQEAVAAVLVKSGRFAEGDDPEKAVAKVTRRTTDGVTITPLAGSEVAKELADGPTGADAVRGRSQQARQVGDVPAWDLRVHLTDSADSATDELEGGATSLWVSTEAVDLAKAIDGVLLDVAPVVLDSPRPLEDLDTLEAAAKDGLHPDTNLGIDVVGTKLLTGSEASVDLAEAARRAQAAGVRAFVVDASIVHDAGAGEVLELGYAAAAGVDLLRRLDDAGVAPVDAMKLVEFRYSATDHQFTTIAKLRAARAIWARICAELGVEDDVQRQHAMTSGRMMTQFDPFTNLLRLTVATFAAAVGGAEAITVQTHDSALGTSDAFGQRMARNVSNLLVHESHIGQVTDPAGGSGSIERLTDDLARAGWEKFAAIEGAGLASFVDQLPGELEQALAKRAERIASRKQPITGVSEFPQTDEQVLVRDPGYSRFKDSGLIRAVHDADAFEDLRRQPAKTPVFLWPVGNLAQSTARATFAANTFAAGGVPVVLGTAGTGDDAIAEQFRQAGTKVVCLVGSDPGYSSDGPAVVEAAKKAGAQHVMVAGKPVPELADVVDDHLALGQNALELLDRTRTALGETR